MRSPRLAYVGVLLLLLTSCAAAPRTGERFEVLETQKFG